MISYVVGLVQYYNQSPYYPAIIIKNNELQIRAMNDENKFEVISCRLDLPDLAIQWCYNQFNDFINGFKVFRKQSRIIVVGQEQDELRCFQEYIKNIIPFTNNWQDIYDFIAEQPTFFEINSILVKDRITKQKQLLKRIYEKIQVPGDEFKIQVFLKKNPHPNILQYNSHYVEDRKQFISLDYYKQGTLKNIFNKFRNHIPLNIVRKIMEQLLNGLDHLHSNGIMHRDIQPENIIVTNFDEIQIKIANFTLSVFGEQFTRFCGKKCYAAPEVVNHFIHTNKCDIYSAGVVFYELLNCKQIQRHFDPQIACIELKKQGLNDQAVDLVTQMLDIDPIRRLNIDDCLSHKFFTDEESQVSNYKYLLNKNQVNPKLSQINNC